ncbi:MAG: hypothetical protein M1828_000091 [Chrysothrix sp. TS-e1954]|nr:MAG: hypothetical protein M1828_000091 [Chrysothrix sp. TS-e1954]
MHCSLRFITVLILSILMHVAAAEQPKFAVFPRGNITYSSGGIHPTGTSAPYATGLRNGTGIAPTGTGSGITGNPSPSLYANAASSTDPMTNSIRALLLAGGVALALS